MTGYGQAAQQNVQRRDAGKRGRPVGTSRSSAARTICACGSKHHLRGGWLPTEKGGTTYGGCAVAHSQSHSPAPDKRLGLITHVNALRELPRTVTMQHVTQSLHYAQFCGGAMNKRTRIDHSPAVWAGQTGVLLHSASQTANNLQAEHDPPLQRKAALPCAFSLQRDSRAHNQRAPQSGQGGPSRAAVTATAADGGKPAEHALHQTGDRCAADKRSAPLCASCRKHDIAMNCGG